MSIYNRLRLDIKHEQVEIKADELKVDQRRAAGARPIQRSGVGQFKRTEVRLPAHAVERG
jgi:hypothetical protein